VLFAIGEVQLSAPVLGAVVACGSLAGVAGAALSGRVARLLTASGAMAFGQFAIVMSMVVLSTAAPGVLGVLVMSLAQVLFAAGLQIFSVTQISLRQAITPPHVLGRVNATRRVVVFGIQPFGALLGGVLGTAIGLRSALIVAAAIQLVAFAMILRGWQGSVPLHRGTQAR
jgi:hypothetical protein